jgi:hypothetical protein
MLNPNARLSFSPSPRHIYAAFLLFPPFFPEASVPLAATSGENCGALSASNISALYPCDTEAASVGTRLGSNLAMTGIDEASMLWKGGATKWPAASNQSAKGRVKVIVSAFFEEDLGVTVTDTVYSGMFFRVEVAIVICLLSVFYSNNDD